MSTHCPKPRGGSVGRAVKSRDGTRTQKTMHMRATRVTREGRGDSFVGGLRGDESREDGPTDEGVVAAHSCQRLAVHAAKHDNL